ncbi:heavy metal resistance protein CzcA [Candidatus Bathyarchaeota archaeon]|nr:MAG: heavy metal resistance protein CzcA [Candidatus Bathyarchaeota archaeon]
MRRIRIVVDERERASGIPEILRKRFDLMIEMRTLDVGDYLLPSYAIERKEVHDLVRSIFNGRLFDQAERITDAYPKTFLIVEGDVNSILKRGVNPQVYWGAISTLVINYGLQIFFTSDKLQTANLLYALAKRAPRKLVKPLIRRKPRVNDLKQMQILQVSSLPGVGPKMSERLLTRFGSVRRVFTASVAELSTVKGLGRAKAEKIVKLLDAPYQQFRKGRQRTLI